MRMLALKYLYAYETSLENQRKILKKSAKLNKQISQLMDVEEGD